MFLLISESVASLLHYTLTFVHSISSSNILIGLLMHLKRHPTSSMFSSGSPTGNSKPPGPAKAKLDVKTREREGAGQGPPHLKPKPDPLRLLSQGEELSIVASSPSFVQDPTPSEESTGSVVSNSHPPLSSSSSDSQTQRHRLAFVKLPIPLPSFSTAARLMTYVDADAESEERDSDGEAGAAAEATALHSNPTRKRMEVQSGRPRGSAAGAVPMPIPKLGSIERSTSDDMLVFEGPFGKGKGEGVDGSSALRGGHSWGKAADDKDHEDGDGEEEDGEGEESDTGRHQLQQEALQRRKQWTKPGAKRTMWHTALTLILERGRPITRVYSFLSFVYW